MRTAHMDKKWYLGAGGELLGVSLGYGGCAEHEHGIAPLHRLLGIASADPLGVDDRKNTLVPEDRIVYREGRKKVTSRGQSKTRPFALLRVTAFNAGEEYEALYGAARKVQAPCSAKTFINAQNEDLWLFEAAWDDEGFDIVTFGPNNVERLRHIHQALLRADLCVSLGQALPFGGSGLNLIIASRISQEDRNKVLQADQEHLDLKNAVLAIGIEQELLAAGKRYYALCPAWANTEKTDVHFFLNPREQNDNNSGWFTAEDLRDWIDGKGPIPKTEEAERERARG